MTADQWARIKEVFCEAVAVPSDEREGFVQSRCGDDRQLRAEVLRLLANHEVPTVAPGEGPAPRHEIPSLPNTRYEVQRLAGSGGMGQVFRARDTLLNRPVALKVLAAPRLGMLEGAHGSGTEAERARLTTVLREARAMAAFAHAGVCRVIDVSTDTDPPFIVMEWVDGTDLLTAWEGLEREDRLWMFLKVVDAVSAVHGAGLVHGDLKPANILVTDQGEPVVVDFGLAVGPTAEGAPRGGTPGYAAPEQLDLSAPGVVAPSADVYALGVILYEMLTDRAPHTGPTPADLVRQAREEDPPLPETLAPDCPASLQRVCLAALERDAAGRYPTARELGEDLRRYLRGESVLACPTQLATRFAEQVEQQIQQAGRWAIQGLVTEGEAKNLGRRLARLLRPDSPWIVDSRRLTYSQVSLYLGGWLAIIAMSIGVTRAWDSLGAVLQAVLPVTIALVMIAAGLALHRWGHRRAALVYLITASLAVPIATDLVLRESRLFSNGGLGMGEAELVPELFGMHPPPQGLFNGQLLVVALMWFAMSVGLRLLTRSSAFSLLGTVALVVAWLWVWLVRGELAPPLETVALARLGAFLLPLAVVGVVSGALLSSAEQSSSDRVGHDRARRADSWPILSAGVFLAVAGLWLIVAGRPTWYLVPQLAPVTEPPVTGRRALATMCAGVAVLGLSWVLARRPGEAREQLAVALRWVLPSHFLASLIWLYTDQIWALQREWLVMAAGLSIITCFISVWKQWKPFLVNGLVYLGTAYYLAFDDDAVRSSWMLQVLLVVSAAALGLGIMVAAWWLPDRLASGRVRRALLRVKRQISTGGRTARHREARPDDARRRK